MTAARRRSAFVIGAAMLTASAVWMFVAVRDVLAMLDHGSGALGSAGVGSAAYLLPVVLTAWLYRRSRDQGPIARRLRGLYAVCMTALLTVFVVFASQLFLPRDLFGDGQFGWYLFKSGFVAGALWLPMQAFFAAAFVAILVARQDTSTR